MVEKIKELCKEYNFTREYSKKDDAWEYHSLQREIQITWIDNKDEGESYEEGYNLKSFLEWIQEYYQPTREIMKEFQRKLARILFSEARDELGSMPFDLKDAMPITSLFLEIGKLIFYE